MQTTEVAARYSASWISGDRVAVRRTIAPDAEIEWNLDLPVDDEELIQILHRIAGFADSISVVSQICTGDSASFIYDCAAPFGTVRLCEFLTVTGDKISEIRHVYDTTALRRYFPGLLDD
ncbi:hypothetical protein [Actinoplanes sp. NPDC051859]|uniref:hypothetical protein n=1 Tax=Actinoplanes sp. NPDC051859 TaxID=3363909 RepID=UPI0037939ADF